jgi:hypothetical protein
MFNLMTLEEKLELIITLELLFSIQLTPPLPWRGGREERLE